MAENKNNQTNTPDTQGNTPDTQGNTPDTQGNTPDTQGNTPDTQGNTPDTQGTAPKTTTKGAKKEKLVSVYISKQSRNDTERFIAVNGERILVQTGKTVEIPERFAEVIRNSEKMSADAEKYIEDNISKS